MEKPFLESYIMLFMARMTGHNEGHKAQSMFVALGTLSLDVVARILARRLYCWDLQMFTGTQPQLSVDKSSR